MNFGKGPPLTAEQRAVHGIRADETLALHARIAELELAAKWEGDLAQQALDDLKKRDARIAELEAALKEVHRRTGLLMTQNQGRWNMSLEHDRRTADVLSVNQDISSAALEKKND